MPTPQKRQDSLKDQLRFKSNFMEADFAHCKGKLYVDFENVGFARPAKTSALPINYSGNHNKI